MSRRTPATRRVRALVAALEAPVDALVAAAGANNIVGEAVRAGAVG